MNIKQIILKRLAFNTLKSLAYIFIFALTATTQGATRFYTKLQNGGNVKMMNMGTSLSYGYNLPEATRVANRWTGQLQTELDGLFAGQTTIDNQAISASNSGNANTNFVSNGNGLQIIDNRLANHALGSLDLVVFEYATNDSYTGYTSGLVSLAETTTNLNSLIAKVKAHSPNAEIILLSGTFFQPGSLADTNRPDIEAYNAAWKAIADADPNIYYADAHSVFKAQQAADPTHYKTDYVPDDIHPTVAGQTIFKDAIMGTIVDPQVTITRIKSTSSQNAFKNDISTTDLINAGQTTLSSSVIESSSFGFPAGGVNDGTSTDLATGGNTFFSAFPAKATFDLDVSTNTLGYNITSIQSLMGWATVSSEQANQNYTVEVKTVATGTYTTIATVKYTPFSGVSTGSYDTKVNIAKEASGILATGVDSIRFTFSNPGGTTAAGTLVREIDVMGYPVGGSPNTVFISSPASRTIIQRSPANTADIPIQGTFIGSPDSIQARAIVMAGGGNSGTSSAWTTIDASPSGGNYSGTLTAVPAGGWYQIEIRSVTNGAPSNVITRKKIGVGDLFIIAGQSNSANHGGPTYTPTDDRVCMRTSFTAGNWVKLADPIHPATGNGGSPWSRLGQLIADNVNIPVGFVSVGVGGTRADQWVPGTSFYNDRLKPTLQSFSANSFRAVLWHQGESDAITDITAADHKALLKSIIDQSRTDAGWTVPWYISEAAFVPIVKLASEEKVMAGQRAMVQDDANVHLGSSTDEFHLENKVRPDGIHFNGAGLADHAAQWKAILYDDISASIINGNFEDNTTAGITTVSPLADNAVHSVNIADVASLSILDWHILDASGLQAAGSGGYFNPGNSSYTGAIDTINAGVLPNMSGKHVAFLSGGNAGDHFLQTTRALLKPHRKYTLTVALGLRDVGSSVFGGAKIEILANGQPLGAGTTISKAQLDALAGGSASGKFTDVSYSFSTTETITAGQNLAVRISKINGGGSIYLDFDNVRLTEAPTSYGAWQNTHWGGNIADANPSADPDGDGLNNLLEFAFGFNPKASSHSQSILSLENGAFRVTRKVPAATNLSYILESSTTLQENSWVTVPSVTVTPITSDGITETVDFTRAGGWNSATREFYRLRIALAN